MQAPLNPSCPNFPANSANIHQLFIIISASLSVVGSLTIITSYVVWPDLRCPLRKLVVLLSVVDFITAAGNLVGSYHDTDNLFCTIQSFITTSSSISSFLWTMFIGVYLFLVISKQHKRAVRTIPVFIVLAFMVPLIPVSVAMAFGALGFSPLSGLNGWCWISRPELITWPHFAPENRLLFWQFVAGKGIEIFTYIFTPVMYVLSKKELDYQSYDHKLYLNPNVRTTLHDTDRKLILIPLIFIAVRMWGTIRYIGTSAGSQVIECSFWLAVMQGFGDSAQGFANCILYCVFTRKVREKFAGCFKGLVCCLGRKESAPTNATTTEVFVA